jgi:hypothetical protein
MLKKRSRDFKRKRCKIDRKRREKFKWQGIFSEKVLKKQKDKGAMALVFYCENQRGYIVKIKTSSVK